MFPFKGLGQNAHRVERVLVAPRGALNENHAKPHGDINTQTHIDTNMWKKSFHIQFIQFSQGSNADKLNEPHEVLKRLCCLGSKVKILSCITKRASQGSCNVYVEIPPKVWSIMHRFGLVGEHDDRLESLCSFQMLGGLGCLQRIICPEIFLCGLEDI